MKHIHIATVEALTDNLDPTGKDGATPEYDEWQGMKHKWANWCNEHGRVMVVTVGMMKHTNKKRFQTKCPDCCRAYDKRYTERRREIANKRKKYQKQAAAAISTHTGLRYADEQRLMQYRLDREAQAKRRDEMTKRVASHPYLKGRISK